MSNQLAVRSQTLPVAVYGEELGFRTFIASAMHAPILTAREESDLFSRLQKEKDLLAAQTLVFSHIRLVYKTTLEYRGYKISIPDLVQEGTLGLMKAVKRFDPMRGVRLASYAIWWIRASIHEYIMRSLSLVKIVTTTLKRKLFFKLRQAKKDFSLLSREEAEVLATQFGTDPDTILNMDVRLSGPEISLDQPTLGGDGKIMDFFSDDRPGPESQLISKQQRGFFANLIAKGIDSLEPREQVIIQNRFLLEQPKTLEEIGKTLSISRERVRQLEKKALGKLKNSFLLSATKEDLTYDEA